jgi:hypothetical protein
MSLIIPLSNATKIFVFPISLLGQEIVLQDPLTASAITEIYQNLYVQIIEYES